MSRSKLQEYPDLSAELDAIRRDGITPELLCRIITRHKENALYNRMMYRRYKAAEDAVPIFSRKPRFSGEQDPINNKLNNDFFGEIVDFKTGYFAGKAITYSYSKGVEAQEDTGGEDAVTEATRTVTDFTTRNNMYGKDMALTKLAATCGYVGRLFYIDKQGNERCMITKPFETIVLSDVSLAEPEYAIRYFKRRDINNKKTWVVEFYDDTYVYIFRGGLSSLKLESQKEHCFDYCPLQIIVNNEEMLGDAEKVLTLIDDYDKVMSDNSNELEGFVHAYMIFDGVKITDDEIQKARTTGAIKMPPAGTQTQRKVYFLTKEINDAFTEHHITHIEDNIYRFSKTPNLNDETFGSASGVSLKFKLHGLETKCGMFQANVMDAAQYMWQVLCSAWQKREKYVDPLHITMDFKRNFPLDIVNEAQAASTLKAAGLPDRTVFGQLSFIDDVDEVMEEIEMQKGENMESEYEKVMKALQKQQGEAQGADDEVDADDETDE